MTENEISYIVRKCVFNVYNQLGPGLLESVYQKINFNTSNILDNIKRVVNNL
ncbi:GxxExxY protein [Chryseobacterium sp. WLY505]|uniref:GxxExxY protein n=1 Tax=Chryseobacterium sp. WLY505 TaxID=3068892 RepID=UPI002796C87B|nr:GxxExxY protein [Chryseobacterium sp. WLY505]MDQ1858674.1 GxxExxY protein [Chryseobacterium sp. WLY505]